MTVNRNSYISYGKINRDRKIAEVLTIYKSAPRVFFTDREVMDALGYYDPNKVRPGITWALEDNLITKSGALRWDASTGREVRQCRFNYNRQLELQRLFSPSFNGAEA